MMRRWSHVMLIIWPLLCLGIVMWVMKDATALLDSNLQRTQP